MNDESKLKRRGFFKGAATLAGAVLVGAVIPIRDASAQKKLAKEVFKYQDTPKDGQRCDECVYWQPPKGCGIVEGDIAAAGWCTAYNKKK